jgi:hypothetical protein
MARIPRRGRRVCGRKLQREAEDYAVASAFACFLNRRTMMSRFRRDRKSMMSLPSRWSISFLLFSVEIRVAHRDGGRPLDLDAHVGNRQAALLMLAHLRAQGHDLGVDEDQGTRRLLVLGSVEHDQAARHAHLDRREAHAGRRVHGFQHVGGELADALVDAFDGRTFLAQKGIGKRDDGEHGHGADIG